MVQGAPGQHAKDWIHSGSSSPTRTLGKNERPYSQSTEKELVYGQTPQGVDLKMLCAQFCGDFS